MSWYVCFDSSSNNSSYIQLQLSKTKIQNSYRTSQEWMSQMVFHKAKAYDAQKNAIAEIQEVYISHSTGLM